ncbi:hypothetical protein MPL3365_140126 [Mesorhizobium plurifarium]|uniref:Uncharacterized protein n=1 Tax=Mesorhizobium plurifarium TaxID=69974 RepID=A0A090G412_MESPL|nr:hypothetical protein MPL3365_140126 [Mesorhizobium plurifarium]
MGAKVHLWSMPIRALVLPTVSFLAPLKGLFELGHFRPPPTCHRMKYGRSAAALQSKNAHDPRMLRLDETGALARITDALCGLAYRVRGWTVSSDGFSQAHVIGIEVAEIVNVIRPRGYSPWCPGKVSERDTLSTTLPFEQQP